MGGVQYTASQSHCLSVACLSAHMTVLGVFYCTMPPVCRACGRGGTRGRSATQSRGSGRQSCVGSVSQVPPAQLNSNVASFASSSGSTTSVPSSDTAHRDEFLSVISYELRAL